MSTRRVAILGAGFTGLAAAYDLSQAGAEVTLYEREDGVGGLAAGFREPHWSSSVERFYHHWFTSDRHMLGWLGELGLADRVVFSRPVTVVYHENRFYPFDSVGAALRFPGLGWGVDKARFGAVGAFLRLNRDWRSLEKHTVDSWMRRWAGHRVYEAMWEPLMAGKFGPDYAKAVNMAWLWARLHVRTPRLGTFSGGFQALLDTLADRLRGMQVELRLAATVVQIRPAAGGGVDVTTADRETARYDQCLVTSSPSLLARLAPDLPPAYTEGCAALKSLGAVVLILALRRPLSEEGYYWFNLPKSAGFPFLSLVEHTNFVSPTCFGGDTIVYLGDYIGPEHEYFRLSEGELLERFLPSLARINPEFEPDWVRKSWLHRTPYAQPVPLVDHSRNIPPIETPVAGLYFASMSQVYPWDRGTNFAVEIGRRAARRMLSSPAR